MRVEELERELRAERPEPDLDFARRLDEWAEAGFPRDRGLGPRTTERQGPLARLWERITAVPARRLVLPVGAAATACVVAAVAVTQYDGGGGTELSDTASSSGDAGGAGAVQEEAAPSEAVAPDAGAGAESEFNLDAPEDADSTLSAPDAGGIARGEDERVVDATARISLGAEADEVQDVANGVVEVTDRHNGVVVDSQVTSDTAGARASFELEIPYTELDATLADLSGLGDVISRSETTEDITARAVRARKDLAELHDRIREARMELIKADTREDKLILRSEISSLEAQADAAEAALNRVQREGRFASVNVDVSSDGPASGDDGWSLGDALDDAGSVLETIGGIALVTLAVLIPVALVAALAAFALSRYRARERDRALGG
jgi:hypothetical protein